MKKYILVIRWGKDNTDVHFIENMTINQIIEYAQSECNKWRENSEVAIIDTESEQYETYEMGYVSPRKTVGN
jgi:hypothetical protein